LRAPSGHVLGADFDIKEMLPLSLSGGRRALIYFPQFPLDDHRLLTNLLSKDSWTMNSQSWDIEMPAAAAASGSKLVSVIPGIVLTSRT
jgi:hypothetical protein